MNYLNNFYSTKDVHGCQADGICIREYENVITLHTGFVVHKETINPKHKRKKAQSNQGPACFDLEKSQDLGIVVALRGRKRRYGY